MNKYRLELFQRKIYKVRKDQKNLKKQAIKILHSKEQTLEQKTKIDDKAMHNES